MSGPKIIVALCLLVPLASALLIHYVGSSSGSGSDRDAAPREGKPVGDGRRNSGWTRQSLREALDGRSPPTARGQTPWRERADRVNVVRRGIRRPKGLVSPICLGGGAQGVAGGLVAAKDFVFFGHERTVASRGRYSPRRHMAAAHACLGSLRDGLAGAPGLLEHDRVGLMARLRPLPCATNLQGGSWCRFWCTGKQRGARDIAVGLSFRGGFLHTSKRRGREKNFEHFVFAGIK